MKKRQSFSFAYPLRQKVVKDLRIVTETVGTLLVEGTGYFDPSYSPLDIDFRYKIDIDFIRWNGTDIKPVLEVVDSIDDIHEEALRYFANQVDNSQIAA